MSRLLLLALLTLVTSPAFPARLSDLQDCFDAPDSAGRKACYEQRLTGDGVRPSLLRQLHGKLPQQATPILELVDVIESGPASAPDVSPTIRAALQDLRGSAYLALEKGSEAAQALGAAMELDDGVARMTWLRPATEPRWSAELDPGSGRLQRTARALDAAGKRDEARDVLARALVLGADAAAVEHWQALDGGPLPGREPGELVAGPWRQRLRNIDVQLFGGDKISLLDNRGKVIVLDFWASWCAPCLDELPHLQELYDAERERGLVAVAINNGDTAEVAREFADDLGLTLPIGFYDRAIHAAFQIRTLPTVVVADRNGRIRARWDGYKDGIEYDIAKLVHGLLGEDMEPREKIGEVIFGEGAISVDWVREAGRPIAGLAVLSGGDEDPRIVAALSRSLALFDALGDRKRVVTIPAFVGRLRQVDLDGDGEPELIGYRPGRSQVGVLSLDDREHVVWDAPSVLLDVQARPAREEIPGELILGTVGGLYRADPAGESIVEVDGFHEVSGLALSDAGVAVLEAGGKITWMDPSFQVTGRAEAPRGSWNLVPGPGPGAGAVPGAVAATASGRFIPGEEPLLAVGLTSGQLVLLNPATGEARFRARFEGPVGALAAVDIEGDGTDELVLAAGRKLALLRGRALEVEESGGM